jgi:hypothetical protein
MSDALTVELINGLNKLSLAGEKELIAYLGCCLTKEEPEYQKKMEALSASYDAHKARAHDLLKKLETVCAKAREVLYKALPAGDISALQMNFELLTYFAHMTEFNSSYMIGENESALKLAEKTIEEVYCQLDRLTK